MNKCFPKLYIFISSVARIIRGFSVLVSGELWIFLGGNLRLVVTAK